MKLIATFSLSGIKWNVTLVDYIEGGYRWKRDIYNNVITVSSKHNGTELSHSTIERNIWDAILFIIIVNIMLKKKYNERDVMLPYSGFVYQVYSTLVMNKEKGWFNIGEVRYTIEPDNEVCDKDDINGRINPNTSKIIYRTCDKDGIKIGEPFKMQTIWHEIVHAINYEMGMDLGRFNKESNVNILSYFLFEVHSTLREYKIKPTKNGTNKKSTRIK